MLGKGVQPAQTRRPGALASLQIRQAPSPQVFLPWAAPRPHRAWHGCAEQQGSGAAAHVAGLKGEHACTTAAPAENAGRMGMDDRPAGAPIGGKRARTGGEGEASPGQSIASIFQAICLFVSVKNIRGLVSRLLNACPIKLSFLVITVVIRIMF